MVARGDLDLGFSHAISDAREKFENEFIGSQDSLGSNLPRCLKSKDFSGCNFPETVSDHNLSESIGDQYENSKKLIFQVQGSVGTPVINVFEECLEGKCECVHLINGRSTNLMPCRFAHFLSGEGNVLAHDPEMAQFIWEGIVNGFKIVNDNCETSYFCSGPAKMESWFHQGLNLGPPAPGVSVITT